MKKSENYMEHKIQEIRALLHGAVTVAQDKRSRFFKTDAGEYAEHDRFIGVTVPKLRSIAKGYTDLACQQIQTLLDSPFNEERLLALFILVHRYQKAQSQEQHELYHFYLNNIQRVNNWNLVDACAHLIIGAHLFNRDRTLLLELAQSANMWKRRIAIVATWYFIRRNDLAWTFKLAQMLLNDTHDLMHKAVGWMLREAGKRDQKSLTAFLELHAHAMPRTMLRYALEKFDKEEKDRFMRAR